MMMVPYMFHDALLDDWFQNDWDRDFDRMMEAADPRRAFGKRSANVMKTDVRETENGYDVFVDLPGFKKEDVKLDLQNGYLTVSARRDDSHEDKDGNGRWLRRERYAGSCSRSFYVGEDVKDSDIHASYKDGTLCLEMPMPEARRQVEDKHQIAIEG